MKRIQKRLSILAGGAFLSAVLSIEVLAQLEKRYDPEDGFDQQTGDVDYRSNWWDYHYGIYDWPSQGSAPPSSDYNVSRSASRDASRNYGWHYDWDPVNGEWRSDYGFYSERYDRDARGDYGWHYDWNPNAQQWVPDYGFHSTNYDIDYSRYSYRDNPHGVEVADRDQQERRRGQERRMQEARKQMGNGQHFISGHVDGFRRVGFRQRDGAQQQNALVRLRLQNGQAVVVDLGEQGVMRRLDLQQGDYISIRGRQARMGEEQILVAQQMRVNGRSYNLERPQQDRSQQQQRNQADVRTRPQLESQTSPDRSSFRENQNQMSQQTAAPFQSYGEAFLVGTIDELREVNMGGTSRSFVQLKLEDGRSAIVDLGPGANDQLRRLLNQADPGDPFTLEGWRRQVAGRNVILAESLSINGIQYVTQ